MSRFTRFGGPHEKIDIILTAPDGTRFVDYKDVESLRRMMSPNGKLYGRKRLQLTAQDQKLVAQAIKRARFLGMLPFTSATL